MFCYWCKIHIIITTFFLLGADAITKKVLEKEFSLVSIFSLNAAVMKKKKKTLEM